MKYAWIIAPLCFYLGSCETRPEEYYIERILVGERLIDITKVIVEKVIQANKISLTYETNFDTISYLIDQKSKVKLKLVTQYFNTDTIYLLKEYSIATGNKTYTIDHFSASNGALDGSVEFYWNEDLGMFFTHGSSWPRYFILQSTDYNKNKIIWDIIKKVYPPINEQLEYMEQLKKDGFITER